MPNIFPTGTTWIDLATLVGVVVAAVGVVLAARRDRRESKLSVRVEVAVVPDAGLVAIVMTNTERRPVAIQRARLLTRRHPDSIGFERWHDASLRTGSGGLPRSEPALPKTLTSEKPIYWVVAGPRAIKSALFPTLPTWALCEDIFGNRYWAKVPPDVQAAIKATKRQVPGPVDDYNMPTWIDIEDDVAEPSAEPR